MKNILTTILAATLLAGNTLASAYDDQIKQAAYGQDYTFNSPASQALLTEIMAKPTLSNPEATAAVYLQAGKQFSDSDWSDPANLPAMTAVAPKNDYVRLLVKVQQDRSTEGWTDQDILGTTSGWPNASLLLISNLGLPLNDPFVQRVVALLNESGAGATATMWQDLFSRYRASLPTNEQIVFTQKGITGATGLAVREDFQNEWITRLTLDLIALKNVAKE